MAEIVVSEADRGGMRSLRVGDTVVVQLAETPSTGFRWALAGGGGDIVELTQDDFQPGQQSGTGGGGLRIFRFVAKRAGSSRLEFSSARSWEPVPPRELFDIKINVS